MHRFLVPPSLLTSESVRLPEETARQITRVLRLREGERITLFSGDGTEVDAVLTQSGPEGVEARVEAEERRAPAVELACRLHVGVAVLKGEKLDWVVQKLTELGAARISFMTTRRTIVDAGVERWVQRMTRYRRIATEAAEQCGRVRLPEVAEPAPLATLLGGAETRKLFLTPGAEMPLGRALSPCAESLLLLIGPEGGFTPEEAELARAAGGTAVTLGPRVLRAETAALAAAALVAAADAG